MDQLSNKLKKVLNELAILNHPEQKNNKNFYSNSQLLEISKLGSESYLLAQALLENISIASIAVVDKINIPVTETTIKPKEQIIETKIVNEPIEVKIPTPEPIVKVQVEKISNPIVEVTTITEPIKEPKITPIETPIPKAEEISKTTGAVDISKNISITRRFEYVSKLFKGDENAYLQFINEINSSTGVAWLGIYDKFYTNLDWAKKAESASELKSVISKNMN